jgi:hypothetical protein
LSWRIRYADIEGIETGFNVIKGRMPQLWIFFKKLEIRKKSYAVYPLPFSESIYNKGKYFR